MVYIGKHEIRLSKIFSGLFGWVMAAFLLLYIISPIDFIPEAFFGPLGLLDDFVALLMAWGLIKGNKNLPSLR